MKIESNAELSASIDLASLGLRPITRWVPNTRDPAFIEQYRQQRAKIAASVATASDDIEWWEKVQSHDGWS